MGFCVRSFVGYTGLCARLVLQLSRWVKRACGFGLNAFLLSCDSHCSVALPQGADGWSAECYCSNF